MEENYYLNKDHPSTSSFYIKFTEQKRSKWCRILLVLTKLLIIFSIFGSFHGFYILAKHNRFSEFIVTNTSIVIKLYFTSSLMGIIINFFTFILALIFITPSNRSRIKTTLLIHFFITCLVWIFHLSVFIITLKYLIYLPSIKDFNHNLYNAMHNYDKEPVIKLQIDEMQMLFGCCGSKTYSDWFRTNWINPKSVSGKEFHEKYLRNKKNVPFSCCSTKSTRPCVSENVERSNSHYDFNKHLTLNKVGCSELLRESISYNFLTVNAITLLLSIGDFIFGILFRLLYQSVVNKRDLASTGAVRCNLFYSWLEEEEVKEAIEEAKRQFFERLHKTEEEID